MQILNGPWCLATDAGNQGKAERWFERMPAGALNAPVPGIIQQVFPAYHGVAWYWHAFAFAEHGAPGERVLCPLRRGRLPGGGVAERTMGRLI